MNRHLTPGGPEFLDLFRSFTREAWRLELLQQYGNSNEDERLARFFRGEPYQHTQAKQAWLDIIATAHARGATVGRVHVVQEPLSDYMRYELSWGYPANVEAGEDIRILPQDEYEQLGLRQQDFWMFDGELYLMHYAVDGTWLDVEHVTEPRWVRAALAARDLTRGRAMPYLEYMHRHPDLQTAVAA